MDIFQPFYDENLELSRFNRAYIALVPKITGARHIGEFRPISLINGTFKIISKIFAGPLKQKIGDLIEPFQPSFLTGWSILDSVVSAQKIISLAPHTNGQPTSQIRLHKSFWYDWLVLYSQTPSSTGIWWQMVRMDQLLTTTPWFRGYGDITVTYICRSKIPSHIYVKYQYRQESEY